jgi:hypothetical protein
VDQLRKKKDGLKKEIFYGAFVVLGNIEKYWVVLRNIKHFNIPTI